MRILCTILVIGGLTTSLLAEDELDTMDRLIALTSEQLEAEKELRAHMGQLSQLKSQFYAGKDTPAQAKKIVHTARRIYHMIEDFHLQHVFSPEYLEEISFFTSLARKEGMKRP